jgi:hypothetical protein
MVFTVVVYEIVTGKWKKIHIWIARTGETLADFEMVSFAFMDVIMPTLRHIMGKASSKVKRKTRTAM